VILVGTEFRRNVLPSSSVGLKVPNGATTHVGEEVTAVKTSNLSYMMMMMMISIIIIICECYSPWRNLAGFPVF
jgi:uncharacterized membrane protein (DUF2068 family)